MKKTFVVPPSLSVGPKKWLKNAIIGIGGLILVCSPVSAAGLMGPNASAIPTKSVGDSLRITDFNALLDVARKLFVDEKTAGTADDLVGLGTYTADTGTCPAGTTHVDFNDNTTVEAGECFSGVAVVDGNLGIGTLSPSNPLSVRVDNSLQTATARIFNNGVGDSTLLFANQSVGVHLGIDNSDSDKFKISTSETDIAGGTNLLTITQTGAVGMGTITPSEKLDVAGNIAVTGTVDGVDISVLATTVGTNTAGIATNAGNITTNTNNITTNETGIATNITNIAANVTDIATNVADIATNLENIGINTGAIGTKANLVTGATAGNIAGLDVDGNLTDSGLKRNDLGTATTDLWSADKIQSAITAGVGTVTEADTLGTVTARGKSTSTGINLNGTLNDITKGLTFGDADTGFYESVDDTLRFVSGGSLIWTFSDTILGSGATGEPSLRNEVASSTNPNILSNNADSDTGIGSAGDNQLSLIAGGVEGIRVNTATTGVNYLDVTPSATTDAVQIATGGTDTNIDLVLMPKGTGNVGIGTTSPDSALHIAGTTRDTTPNAVGTHISDGQIELTRNGAQPYIDFQNDIMGTDYDMRISLEGDDILAIQGGSIGIGDTTPDGTLKLDVEGQIGSTGYCDENGANCKTIVELSDTGSDNQTLDEVLTSGATTTRTITSGNILPEMTGATGSISTRTLGSDTAWFSDLYADEVHIGANSLYVNGKKVIHDESDTMTFTTDIDQNVKMYTAGTGGLTLESKDTGNLYLKKSGTNGNLQIESSTNATISAVSGISLTIPNSAPAGNHIYLTNSDTDGKIYLNASGISLTSSTAVDVQAGLSATGAITGASFNGVTLANGGSGALTVTGVTSISGSNTGDETTATIKSKLGAATTSLDGYLTSTDWNTFNSKQAALTNPVTGTGTTNYLTKFTGTSAVGNSLVFDNGTNVGIGTANPSTNLHINGGTNAYIKLTDTDSGETATDGFKIGIDSSEQASLWNYENTDMQLATNGALRVVIDSSGNVGIGTDTSPDYLLDVQGTFHADGEASFDGNIAVSGTVDGVDVAGLSTTVGTKADKVSGATAGNIAGLDASGNLTDSGLVLNDTGSTVNDIWSGSKITAAISSGVGEVVEVDTLQSVTDRTNGTTTTHAITTGGLTVDTDTLFVDSTNNRVGIGTVMPTYNLDVYTNGSGTQIAARDTTNIPRIRIANNYGDISLEVGRGSANKFGIYDNNASSQLFTVVGTSGNVGIGTMTPGAKLQVAGSVAGDLELLRLQNTSSDGTVGSQILFETYSHNGNSRITGRSFPSSSLRGSLQLETRKNDGTWSDGIFIDDEGNVGIGTTSPQKKLHIHESSSDPVYMQLTNSVTGETVNDGFQIYTAGINATLVNRENGYLSFETNNSEKLRIDDEGNVGIGTTTPSQKLDIAGGLRVDNNEWISARDSAGTGVVNMFRATTDGSIELGAPLLLGALTADTDSGAVSIFNMPVSEVSTAGTEMSASVQLDSENIFKIYSEADGTGGIQNQSVQVSGDVFAVQYCDENGANCKTVSELSDSGTDDQTLTWTDATNILGITDGNTVEITGFQASNTHLDDLADGTLSSSVLDSDLQDLADGSLSGSKVGTGISGTNITTGTVADARIASTITRDSEWNTQAEVETIWGTTLATDSELALKANIASPTFTGTVSGITSAMVGLGNVTNESKATMFTSPSFTGIPTAPTATSGTSTTQLATTAFVTSAITTAAPAAQTLTWTDATNILGISGGNTVEVTGFQAADADLDDLADGSLSGSKVGTGISGTNITTGTVADARIASTITRDSEWNTQGEVETIWGTTLATDSELTTGLSGKLDKNTAITAGTHTKITYDVDGLVTAGSNATTADIAESGNLYFTNARAITAVGGAKNDTGTGTSDFWSASKIQTAISSSVVTEVDTLATVTGRDATTTEVLTVAGIVTAGTVDGVDVSELNNSVDTNTTAITTKADKVLSATAGHIAGLDVDGNLTDSGLALNDSGSSTTDLWSADKIGSAITTATPAAQTLTWTDATNILGISGGNTVEVTGFQAADADLTDLADGSLSGSKVGTGISGTNITTGTVADARIASTITRDSEWNTQAEVETIWGTTLATDSELTLKANIASPTFTGTVSGITSAMVGLGNVTNESKATMFTNAALTGIPTAPTATSGTNTTQLATTAFVTSAVSSGADTDWVESGGDVYRATGNVGIGTASPLQKFHINDGTNVNLQAGAVGTEFQIKTTNDADSAYIPLVMRASEFNLMNGNVGIGTTSPGQALEISGNMNWLNSGSNAYSVIDRGGTDRRGVLTFVTNGDSTQAIPVTGVNWALGSVDSDEAGDGSEFFIGTDTAPTSAKLWIEGAGNIGIGTTSPDAKLDVNGGLNSDLQKWTTQISETDRYLTLTSPEATEGDPYVFNTNNALDFQTDGTSRLFINENGNVGIGTTSPVQKLQVSNGNIYVNVGDYLLDNNHSLQSVGSLNLKTNNGETTALTALNDGNVGIGTTTPSQKLDIAGGLRVDNDSWLSARDTAGTGFVNMFKVNTNDEIEVGGQLNIGTLGLAEDSGAVTFVNMPVSSTPTAGVEESFSFSLDSTPVLKVYSEADGSGGIQNTSVQVDGAVHANGFCDETGANCKTIAELSNTGSDDQTLTWTDSTNTLVISGGNSQVISGFQASDADLTDLADGSLTGSKVGTGIAAGNITTGTLPNSVLDADLQDLADGSLTGSKVGSGISGTNITTGTVADARIASTITRDSEWNTQAEVETIWGTTLATDSELALKANIANPLFTGIPKAPTATAGTNSMQLATTAFVTAAVSSGADTDWVESGGDVYRATGNVGIGTTSPVSKLHLYEDTSNTDSSGGLIIEQDGEGDAIAQFLLSDIRRWTMGIDNSNSDNFIISEGADLGTDAFLTIDTTGNVGIGTTSPDAKLDIVTSDEAARNTNEDALTLTRVATASAPYSGFGNSILFQGETYRSGSYLPHARIKTQLADSSVSTAGADLSFELMETDTDIIPTERMRIKYDGNVGIGTTSPSEKLEIAGNIKLGTNGSILTNTGHLYVKPATGKTYFMESGVNNYLYIVGVGANDDYLQQYYDTAAGLGRIKVGRGGLSFGSNNVNDRLVLDEDGNVGIGTTTPLSKLHINGGVGSLATGLTFGDGDSGFFESIDDTLQIYTAGTAKWNFAGNYFSGASTGGAKLYQAAASSTQPAFMFSGDENTGIGHAGADQISLIANATEIVNVATTGITVNGNIAVTGTVDGVDISTLSATVTTNTSGIATNVSGIADNVTAIATNATNIGINTGVISGKADMVTGATAGNLAGLDVDGNLTDSGLALNDSGTGITDMWSAQQITSAIQGSAVPEADTLATVTGRGATTTTGITVGSLSTSGTITSGAITATGKISTTVNTGSSYGIRLTDTNNNGTGYSMLESTNSPLFLKGTSSIQTYSDILPHSNLGADLGSSSRKWGGLFTASIVDDGSDVEFNNEIIVERSATAANASSSNQTILGVTDTSAARTITLATADNVDGRIIIIKDESGGASTNNITIVTEGSQTIDGAASIAITADYGVLRVYSNGTNWFSF